MTHESKLTRRDLLKQATLGTAALGMAGGMAGLAGCGGGGGTTGLDPGINQPGDGQGIGEIPKPNPGPARVLIIPSADLDKQEAFYLSANLYTFLATAEVTNGLFSAFDFVLPPGGGPAPHVHSRESETFYAFSGTITETVNRTPELVPIGSLLYGALGQPHSFKNTGNTYGHLLSIVHPSGLEQLFRFAGKKVTNRNAPIPDETEQQLQQTVEVSLHRGDRPFREEDAPPSDPRLLNRVLTVPVGPIDPRLDAIHGIKGYLYGQRPPFQGPFGLNGLNMVSFKETNNTLSFNRLIIPAGTALGADIVNPDDQIYYPISGTLSLAIDGQRIEAIANTFIYIPKGHRYTIGNTGGTPVETLSARVRPGSNLKTLGEPTVPTLET